MDKIERGKRNLEKLRSIVDSREWRGRVTFWNPTHDDKITTTIHGDVSRLMVQLYDGLNADNKESFLLHVATYSGFLKLNAYVWPHATYRSA